MKRDEKYKTNSTVKHTGNIFTWSRGVGKFTKRRLSKARRKYAKMILKFGRGKEPTSIESEANYKGW